MSCELQRIAAGVGDRGRKVVARGAAIEEHFQQETAKTCLEAPVFALEHVASDNCINSPAISREWVKGRRIVVIGAAQVGLQPERVDRPGITYRNIVNIYRAAVYISRQPYPEITYQIVAVGNRVAELHPLAVRVKFNDVEVTHWNV